MREIITSTELKEALRWNNGYTNNGIDVDACEIMSDRTGEVFPCWYVLADYIFNSKYYDNTVYSPYYKDIYYSEINARYSMFDDISTASPQAIADAICCNI